MALQALGAAAERCDRALAHVIGIQRRDQCQAPALLLRRRLCGRLGGSRGADDAAGAGTNRARAVIFIGNVGSDAGGAGDGHRGDGSTGRRRCSAGFGLAKTLLGFELGLALGFLVLAVAFFLGLAAGFGGFALGLLDAFLAVAAL